MITVRRSDRLIDASFAWNLLEELGEFYPALSDWFWNKCVPGIVAGHGVLLLAEDDERPAGNRIVGIALGKRAHGTAEETKLRCIRVIPEYQCRGIGILLIDRALEELGTDRPFCSVSEEMFHDYARLLINRYGFQVTRVERGLYRPGKLEYVFNGTPTDALQQKTPYGIAA